MNIEKTIIEYFKSTLDVKVSKDTKLIEEAIIDSMGVMELLTFIGETFQIEFDLDDMTEENFGTIPAIIRLIELKRGLN